MIIDKDYTFLIRSADALFFVVVMILCFVVMMMLCFCGCDDTLFSLQLSGKRVGILGLGSIGSLIAKRLEPFGCIISYNSTSQKQSIPYLYYPDVLSLAANNDVIVLSCALNDQTHAPHCEQRSDGGSWEERSYNQCGARRTD